MMTILDSWDSFYVIIASSAGALIGLQFVVLTLVAQWPVKGAQGAGAAFATPTIVHFSVSLLVSALMRVPWPATLFLTATWGVIGIGGLIYSALVARRIRRQTAYQPEREDWIFHVLLPALAYALMVGAALLILAQVTLGLFTIAAATLLLLFIGIHNAWDAVSYHVFVHIANEGQAGSPPRDGESQHHKDP